MFEMSELFNELTEMGNIPLKDLITIIEDGVKTAYKLTYGYSDNCIVAVNTNSVDIFELKTVVDNKASTRAEIELIAARMINPNCKTGDKVKAPFDTSLLSRFGILEAALEIYQKTNARNKEIIIKELKHRIIELQQDIENIPEKTNCSRHWKPYFYEYKPWMRKSSVTPEEKKIEEKYGNGYYEEQSNPFPFEPFATEDDYGDESWA